MELFWLVDEVFEISKLLSWQSFHRKSLSPLNRVTVGYFMFMSRQSQPHARGLDKELRHNFDCIFCVDVVHVLQYVSNPLKLYVYIQ
jgi:hypothetical protein